MINIVVLNVINLLSGVIAFAIGLSKLQKIPERESLANLKQNAHAFEDDLEIKQITPEKTLKKIQRLSNQHLILYGLGYVILTSAIYNIYNPTVLMLSVVTLGMISILLEIVVYVKRMKTLKQLRHETPLTNSTIYLISNQFEQSSVMIGINILQGLFLILTALQIAKEFWL